MVAKSRFDESYRPRPEGSALIGEADATERIVVSLHLKKLGAANEQLENPTLLKTKPYRNPFPAAGSLLGYSDATEIFTRFALRHGLRLRMDTKRLCAHLEGTVAEMSDLFETSLQVYHDGHRRFRAHIGCLSVPDEIAPWTLAVLGLDQRPVTTRRPTSLAAEGSGVGLWPTKVGEIYGIPPECDGKNQCVAVIALGGGFDPNDLRLASKKMNRPSARVSLVQLKGGGKAFPDKIALSGVREDTEVALDVQILSALLPAAHIVVYFAENNVQGLLNAVREVFNDGVNNPSVLSISWGGREGSGYSVSDCTTIDILLSSANSFHVTVLAAAGDDLATDALKDHFAHVLFPASSPSVIACGGTKLYLAADGVTAKEETTWNDGLTGTGGGISDLFDVPAYQQSIKMPPSCNRARRGRGLPDVAAAAAPDPGYRIILNGEEKVTFGTSAATPLWAALIAMANAERLRPLGVFHKSLYANPSLCKPIVQCNNRVDGIGYYAGSGWNPCTGWGVPRGLETIKGLIAMP